ncbi:GNAT family N-acetyltransferase [Luteipulveratus mongoliensis]|uniref:N-acetyltransferase domain-containing protein n=1 Tax=Luteipulveratus mongoliensis TaxID=571913 RepID=A0A0K1JP15_9MICO|nr:GNAT family N-acetyltransferase [Luteipulveratus mongoliensis]AKU18328.1 hypothetical protein VV02_24920 [Luteipulveratus mongoliensis]
MTPSALPVLHTDRLELHPLDEQHLDLLVDLDSDPDVTRYLAQQRTREEVRRADQRLVHVGRDEPGLGCWIGFHHDAFIGLWMLTPPDRPDQGPVDGQAELAYRLLPLHWHQGYAREGSRALLRHGFETVGLMRIFAEALADNADARRVLESIGMSYVRGFHSRFDHALPGAENGDVEYALTHGAWVRHLELPRASR